MKKYQVTWGWQPPQYDMWRGNFRLFYFSQEVEREISHKDHETGEVTTETIKEWLCDVVEYEGEESKDILRMLKENKNSLECQRWILRERISAYDSSKHVNSFTIGGMETWLDKATRVGLKLRFEAELRMGKEYTTLWKDGTSFPLPLVGATTAIDMLDGIELYASACYDVTQMHLAAIDKIEGVEEMKAYDYTSGYPAKLSF